MPLQLPNLDDRPYPELVDEARRLIQAYAPEWTNHNPSDPGIALIELFAYLTEMLLYRVNRITDDSQLQFLKLLNGPEWDPGPDAKARLREHTRAAVAAVRARERAVTAADFERLALEDFNTFLLSMQQAEQVVALAKEVLALQDKGTAAYEEAQKNYDLATEALGQWWVVTRLDRKEAANLPSAIPQVRRARCVPKRNLERGTETERAQVASGHVSLIVVPDRREEEQPPPAQAAALLAFLDERRVLTTRHHVVGPYYAPVAPQIVLARTQHSLDAKVRERIRERLAQFLDRLPGDDGVGGWPFGRDVYVSELHEVLESIEGVDYVTDVMLLSECQAGERRCVGAEPIWHREGDLIGLRFAEHHLPLPRIDETNIVIALNSEFLPVQVIVAATKSASADSATIKQLVKAAVRNFFHPLSGGPGPDSKSDMVLVLQVLANALSSIADIKTISVDLHADLSRLVRKGGQIVGLEVKAGEVVNWHVQVEVNDE